jgi:hypothetical protein
LIHRRRCLLCFFSQQATFGSAKLVADELAATGDDTSEIGQTKGVPVGEVFVDIAEKTRLHRCGTQLADDDDHEDDGSAQQP